jgi:hydrogenase expression/formation protein HypD
VKYLDEYRDAATVRRLAERLAAITTRPWTIMEICGGQTHAIVKFGLDELLPRHLTLVHGPGCPVCVTPVELIQQAIDLALRPRIILCSFGDMLRVPGNDLDLLGARARGADVRMVYSPIDAVAMARANPNREVIFFAVGFETTAPANATAVLQAARTGVRNFSILSSHVLVPPAIRAILSFPDNRVNGFLAAGHVCAIAGMNEYGPMAAEFRVPLVVTGFEPVDILDGVLRCVGQLEAGRHAVENGYARAVRPDGNVHARRYVDEVFERCDRDWRGIGTIPQSGLAVRAGYAHFDAIRRFQPEVPKATATNGCIAGQIMRGNAKPVDCPSFGKGCTPECPLGAPMVSTEGACSAYFRYRRFSPTTS